MPVKDVVLRVACLVLVALLGACPGPGVQHNPPAQPGTPLVHRDTVARYGRRLHAALDAVSARLSMRTLRYLNAHVQLGGMSPRSVAKGWLRSESLIPKGQVSR